MITKITARNHYFLFSKSAEMERFQRFIRPLQTCKTESFATIVNPLMPGGKKKVTHT